MKVEDLIVLEGSEEEVSKILGTYTASVEDYSPTFAAMKEHFTEGVSCGTYDVVPFDSVRKRMTTVHKADGQYIIYTKGAPDEVLRCCTQYLDDGGVTRDMDGAARERFLAQNKAYADRALRVLALAVRYCADMPDGEVGMISA